VSLEIQLGIGCLGAAAEAAFTDGLDFADAVLGMVDGLAFSNIDGEFPLLSRQDKKCGRNPAWNQYLTKKRGKLEGFGRSKSTGISKKMGSDDIFPRFAAFVGVRLQRVCPIATAEGNPLL
jgi:hypothetical protein